jgi:hypothetical protein
VRKSGRSLFSDLGACIAILESASIMSVLPRGRRMNLSAVFETLARRYHVTEANPPVYKLTLLRWNWSMGFDSLQRPLGAFCQGATRARRRFLPDRGYCHVDLNRKPRHDLARMEPRAADSLICWHLVDRPGS